jgi:hypothetical protein
LTDSQRKSRKEKVREIERKKKRRKEKNEMKGGAFNWWQASFKVFFSYNSNTFATPSTLWGTQRHH